MFVYCGMGRVLMEDAYKGGQSAWNEDILEWGVGYVLFFENSLRLKLTGER